MTNQHIITVQYAYNEADYYVFMLRYQTYRVWMGKQLGNLLLTESLTLKALLFNLVKLIKIAQRRLYNFKYDRISPNIKMYIQRNLGLSLPSAFKENVIFLNSNHC